MSDLGNLLKTTREAKKITIKDVVDETRIREPFILILEEGAFTKLPSYIHAYGFVKKYAEFLGLDYEKDVWPLFSLECPKDGIISQKTVQEDIAPEEYTPQITETSFIEQDNKSSKKPLYIILVLIILAVVGYGGYYLYSTQYTTNLFNIGNSNAVVTNEPAAVITEPAITFDDENKEDNKSDNGSYFNYYGASIYDNNTDNNTDNGSLTNNTTESSFVDPLFAQNIPTPVTIEAEKVKVNFSENCWFKYKTDKGEENTIDAKKGTTLTLEFDKTFRIEIGNAVAVSLEYEGEIYSNFGRRNMVRILNYEAVNGKLELIR